MAEGIRFVVLGAVQVLRNGAVLPTRSPQQQALLAALLLRSGRAASAHELISAVWGEEPPDSALSTLRTYAWRLRQVMEEDRAAPKLLVSLRDGYQLAVPPESVDAVRAEALAAEAVRARDAGREAECGGLLNEALALWRGEPLTGVPGPFAEQQRSRLGALRLTLLEERFEHRLREGQHGLVIPDLIAFTHEHPMQERPYGFLMRALYAVGRQAEALAVFGRARQVLAEELGIDPGPELTGLHARILAGDPQLMGPAADDSGPDSARRTNPVARAPRASQATRAPLTERTLQTEGALRTDRGTRTDRATQAGRTSQAAPSDADAETEPDEAAGPAEAPAPALPLRPAQLPADAADFTGRSTEVEALCDALTDPARVALPVVSISGMGGIGKSTLALRGAHRAKPDFPGGQLYADLHGNGLEPADPAAVLGSFLTALGTPGHSLPAATEDRARLFRTTLDGRRILLMLDNARDPAQVRPLLPGSADCGVIITSRGRLSGLPTILQTDLDVFDTDEALSLLRSIAGAQRVAEEPEAAAELVGLCGHLPLAVRIVASRLAARPRWRIEAMTARLADERLRIGELRAGDLGVAAAFELGYHQLTDDQARAFRLLAPLARPGIGLEAAAVVLELDEYEAEELLESVVDAAMLEAPQPGRYRYHDLLRSFALQLTSPAAAHRAGEPAGAEGTAALGRLLDHLLDGACSAFQCMVPGDPVGAILGGGTTPGHRFATLADARAWVTSEFDCTTNAVTAAARLALGGATPMLRTATDLLVALTPFGRDIPYAQLAMAARVVAEAAAVRGDDQAEGRARFVCGNAALQNTQLAEAESQTRLATDACRRAEDTVILRQILNDRGLIAQFQHRYADAVDSYDRAIELARELGHRSGELVTRLNAAQARLRSGRAGEAVLICEEVLAELREVGDPHGTSYAWYVHGMALHELERHTDAVTSYTRCLDTCTGFGIRGREAQARSRLAATWRVMGKPDLALSEGETALTLCEELGAEREKGNALLVLGRALADLGDHPAALARAHQAHAVFTRLGLPDAAEAEHLAARLPDGTGTP
ncbi:AfsR/SARP family transcriptional regulator [Streptomyces humi]|uniref:AfsR/SARP family transcriptional regulator n=1 Tax=Streptomyces humi TaxID=1428620 RepID=UPI000628994A|nr:BTAD domain-containing putative transcriptional regulator [Streptomyces humi]